MRLLYGMGRKADIYFWVLSVCHLLNVVLVARDYGTYYSAQPEDVVYISNIVLMASAAFHCLGFFVNGLNSKLDVRNVVTVSACGLTALWAICAASLNNGAAYTVGPWHVISAVSTAAFVIIVLCWLRWYPASGKYAKS